MSVESLALAHKKALVDLSALTERDLRRLWRLLEGQPANMVRDALMDALPVLAQTYGDMAGALAADFYDEVRAEVAARGRFVAEPAPLPGTARYEALVRWGVDPLHQGVPDELAALGRITGGLQRVVANVARDTVVENSYRDPEAHGWKRITSPDACKFCRMLAGRDTLYRREDSARFASHDDCNCSAAPAFAGGEPLKVHQYVASKRIEDLRQRAAAGSESAQRQLDAHNARVRAFVAGMAD